MKKTVKKLTAVGLTLTSVMSLVACGSNSGGTTTSSNNGGTTEVTKPDKFTIMCDNTVVTETNGADKFYEYLAELTGLEFTWVRPDHSGYYDAVANAFNSDDTMPDVVILSSDYYALYASNGFLWDMTDAWNNSETKNSGRLISTADNVLSALMVNGEDGTKAMYGFSPYRGNGCCTYIKAAWLTKAGIDKSAIEGKTLDFNTYYSYLKQMASTAGHYVISSPGFISTEAPYTNYLPEFYQQAQYTFYKNSAGQYVDGFTEQAMKDALQRIQTAVKDGVLDQESVNNSTANARDKFYSTDASSESGVFTYWAGTWANTLATQLKGRGLDNELIALNPIKELGTYVERIAPAWCITTHASNPEGIFKYFIDTMLDGGDVQVAWEYGAKGTHWDDVAETVTLSGKTEGTTYEAGTFHMLPQPEDPTKLMSKNHIDPILALGTFTNGDPGASAISETAKTNGEWFANNSTVATPLPMTEVLSSNITDINTARNYVISQVALSYMTVDEGMAYYNNTVGSLVSAVVKDLNNQK
jgi:ABC-type glycerol-3-phosphate transport system substrate-binding protein